MNEQLQQQLAEYLRAIATTARSGSDFVLQQAPLLVQEKISYGRMYESAWMVLFALGLAFGIALVRKGQRKLPAYWAASDNDEAAFRAWAPIFVGALLCFWGLAGIGFNNQVFFTVWVAPRLYILEWAMELLK